LRNDKALANTWLALRSVVQTLRQMMTVLGVAPDDRIDVKDLPLHVRFEQINKEKKTYLQSLNIRGAKWSSNVTQQFTIEVPKGTTINLNVFTHESGTRDCVRVSSRKTKKLQCDWEEAHIQHIRARSEHVCKEIKKVMACVRSSDVIHKISEMDVYSTFKFVGTRNGWVTPIYPVDPVDPKSQGFGGDMTVKGLKPLTVTDPTVNDYVWDKATVIYGPNGSGKSTFMRAVGHLIILAQCGCNVPATQAKLPVFKHLFLRFGTQDDIIRGKSSFHMEVEHVKYITDHVCERSAVFIDEFGRSTSAREGAALSYGVLKYLRKKCKYVLFATHFPLPDQGIYFNGKYTITDEKQAVNTFEIARKCGVMF
jgi:DNA mismatch repair ATPase MutS